MSEQETKENKQNGNNNAFFTYLICHSLVYCWSWLLFCFEPMSSCIWLQILELGKCLHVSRLSWSSPYKSELLFDPKNLFLWSFCLIHHFALQELAEKQNRKTKHTQVLLELDSKKRIGWYLALTEILLKTRKILSLNGTSVLLKDQWSSWLRLVYLFEWTLLSSVWTFS